MKNFMEQIYDEISRSFPRLDRSRDNGSQILSRDHSGTSSRPGSEDSTSASHPSTDKLVGKQNSQEKLEKVDLSMELFECPQPDVSFSATAGQLVTLPVRMTGRLSPYREDPHVDVAMNHLTAAEEVALQQADDFLTRLEQGLRRRFKGDVPEDDLMFWDSQPAVKKIKLATSNEEGVSEIQRLHLKPDPEGIPLPESVKGSESPQQEKTDSRPCSVEHPQAQIDGEQSVHTLFPNQVLGHTAQNSRQAAIELWQAGIEFKPKATADDDIGPPRKRKRIRTDEEGGMSN
ncbi:hypothetical protein QQS21_010504 [Conoideocrella luteorostrata]|uniref:Uncharacterized protein n=1 Tax=Conoideocrella luteorostrata TaxID=1105319 RepID=A0AAJ0CEW7_9HYPO|nr:hypothetical protein QQS21_010504 [Conoideocrella luteorostrata]